MARPPSGRFPPYPARPHSSGQARIVVRGQTKYLGVFGSPESHQEYARLKAEYDAQTHGIEPQFIPPAGAPKNIADLIARFWLHAQQKYRLPNGTMSNEINNLRYPLRALNLFYGHVGVNEFGPLALKALRLKWIKGFADEASGITQRPLTRKSIGRDVNRIRTLFTWAESEELVPASTVHRLRTVRPLEVGEHGVLETEDVLPVPDLDLRRTLRHLNPIVADMVRIQRLSGARPGEIVAMTPRDIRRQDKLELPGGVTLDTKGIWVVLPKWHKTRRKGHRRIILLGPKAQAILKPYLDGAPDKPIFSPAKAREVRYADMRANRKTKVQPSQKDRKKAAPKRQPREAFSVSLYDQHISKTCFNHGIRHWSAHMLRHNAGSALAEQFGVEVARIVLGHRTFDATRIYVRDSLKAAAEAMREVG